MCGSDFVDFINQLSLFNFSDTKKNERSDLVIINLSALFFLAGAIILVHEFKLKYLPEKVVLVSLGLLVGHLLLATGISIILNKTFGIIYKLKTFVFFILSLLILFGSITLLINRKKEGIFFKIEKNRP